MKRYSNWVVYGHLMILTLLRFFTYIYTLFYKLWNKKSQGWIYDFRNVSKLHTEFELIYIILRQAHLNEWRLLINTIQKLEPTSALKRIIFR